MSIDINDVVVVIKDINSEHVNKGMLGVVVFIFDKPRSAYEIEFCNEEGKTIETITLEPDEIEKVI
ncbi:DUF4926 domain-containing protein [Pseudodesulfovibrio sp. zrk46]|uniref:DUF4926 domain-containing protein n=1 Tax=Pseudodesulfovibrio sp. zrk46 TaxID=2725288 RepID=UPI0014490F81|nr:DUF4926 domain-containing protein [Pseudodesulfovibrio sp. zrk46]QJB56885.1 DUF4926 domain-containing protein [Pseudodesulfovibrio sp. zrk46]